MTAVCYSQCKQVRLSPLFSVQVLDAFSLRQRLISQKTSSSRGLHRLSSVCIPDPTHRLQFNTSYIRSEIQIKSHIIYCSVPCTVLITFLFFELNEVNAVKSGWMKGQEMCGPKYVQLGWVLGTADHQCGNPCPDITTNWLLQVPVPNTEDRQPLQQLAVEIS